MQRRSTPSSRFPRASPIAGRPRSRSTGSRRALKTLLGAPGALRADERGVAIAVVLLIGTILVLVTILGPLRGLALSNLTATDFQWEQALHVAESGVDVTLVELSGDPTYNTGDLAPTPFTDPASEKAWVIGAADAKPETDVQQTPDGEYVVVKPHNADVVYAVGYAPSRAATNRKLRVFRLDYSVVSSPGSTYTSEYAILTGGNLDISGNARLWGTNADAHANGTMFALKPWFHDGCETGYANQYVAGIGCPPLPIAYVPLPVVDPIDAHYLSQYDVCATGPQGAGIFKGPATAGWNGTAGVPCSGDPASGSLGWSVPTPGSTISGNNATPGVYYVAGADVEFNFPITKDITVIAAPVGNVLDCSAPGGSIHVNGAAILTAHAEGKKWALIAGADIFVNGNAVLTGLLAAHEQFHYNGAGTINGPILAEDACNSVGSPIGLGGDTVDGVNGNVIVTYNGGLETPFADPTAGPPVISVGTSIEL